MIGICGFLRLDGGPADGHLLAPMQRALARCGTPSFTQHADGPFAAGAAGWHAHVPVDAGPALYRHPGTGCVVVADARLQGRKALGRDIGLSLSPAVTDAELIAHAWLKHGEGCAGRLDGDFAFVVWDPRTQSLFCARDIMGVRPFYLHHAPGRLFAFASSAPSLLALPGVPNTLNEARIGDFLVTQLEGIDQRSTFHIHVERLPPAHQRSLAAGTSRECRYWRLSGVRLPGMPSSDGEWADALRETLEAVVADHLATDQRVGCMLSGGLDSSSLAVIAADQLRHAGRGPLPTFSTVHSGSDNPETRAIQAMLTLPGFSPYCVERVIEGELANRLWQQMWLSEDPYDAIMTVTNTQYLSAVDAGVGAVMDGVDGDSLFLPGNGQARLLRRGQFNHAWRNSSALARLVGLGERPSRYFLAYARRAVVPDSARLMRRLLRPRLEAEWDPDSLISAQFASKIDLPGRLRRLSTWHAPTPHWDRFEDAREALEHPYITVALDRYRRVAAAYGIDPLHPLTDRRLMTLCSQLPDHLRIGAGQSKHLLRQAMTGRLPEPVRVRGDKKHLGWAHTQALLESHRVELAERMAATRRRVSQYVNPKRHAQLEQSLADARCASGHQDWQAIFDVTQLGHWLERNELNRG